MFQVVNEYATKSIFINYFAVELYDNDTGTIELLSGYQSAKNNTISTKSNHIIWKVNFVNENNNNNFILNSIYTNNQLAISLP